MTNRRPVRVAIVGTGGIAEGAHVPALAAQGDRVQIVAACDVDPERVKSFCDAHDIPAPTPTSARCWKTPSRIWSTCALHRASTPSRPGDACWRARGCGWRNRRASRWPNTT